MDRRTNPNYEAELISTLKSLKFEEYPYLYDKDLKGNLKRIFDNFVSILHMGILFRSSAKSVMEGYYKGKISALLFMLTPATGVGLYDIDMQQLAFNDELALQTIGRLTLMREAILSMDSSAT